MPAVPASSATPLASPTAQRQNTTAKAAVADSLAAQAGSRKRVVMLANFWLNKGSWASRGGSSSMLSQSLLSVG